MGAQSQQPDANNAKIPRRTQNEHPGKGFFRVLRESFAPFASGCSSAHSPAGLHQNSP